MPANPQVVDPAKQQKLVKIMIWGAMLMALLIYCFVGYTHAQQSQIQNLPPNFLEIICVCGAVFWVLGFTLPSIFELLNRRQAQAAVHGATAKPNLGAMFVVWIIRLALFEAICTLGLVLTFLSNDPKYVFLGAGAAAVGFLTAFPR